MSTYAGLSIADTEVESYRNHHDTWFFRRGDRIRENCHREEDGHFTEEAFIGYRASAATIRRRMTLSGYDMEACEQHFKEYLNTVLREARVTLRYFEDSNRNPDNNPYVEMRVRGAVTAYRNFIDAAASTCLTDWITAFPSAVTLSENLKPDYLNDIRWVDVSTEPLVNAMLSDIPFYGEYPCTGLFNFPCNDNIFGSVALVT